MTLPARSAPVAVPLAALLPPSDSAGPSKHAYFPSPAAAILGSSPSTSPFHLALSFLELSDIPDYDSLGLDEEEVAPHAKGKAREAPTRVLVVMPSKDAVYKLLEEEDEGWMRDHGGAYGVIEKLKRVDVRYCPTAAHLKLLLNLLSADRASSGKDPQALTQVPNLILLWDTASLLMEDVESDSENVPPRAEELHDEEMHDGAAGDDVPPTVAIPTEQTGLRRFKPATTISSYLDLISAARGAVDQLSNLHPLAATPQLMILEPSLQPDSSLPIMPLQSPTTPTQRASKRVPIADGLRWMFGPDSVGSIAPDRESDNDSGEASYTLSWSSPCGESDVQLGMIRKPCSKSPHFGPIRVDAEGNPEVAAWQWHWAE